MSAADHRRRRIETFLTLANEETKAAEMRLDVLPRQSAFFQQQAAEKLLVLELEGIPAGPTHNLRTLTDLLDPKHAMKAEFLAIEEWRLPRRGFATLWVRAPYRTCRRLFLRKRQARLKSLEGIVAAFVAG